MLNHKTVWVDRITGDFYTVEGNARSIDNKEVNVLMTNLETKELFCCPLVKFFEDFRVGGCV